MILNEKNKLNIITATLHPDIQQHESMTSECKKKSAYLHTMSQKHKDNNTNKKT